jgi:hypothetical protein
MGVEIAIANPPIAYIMAANNLNLSDISVFIVSIFLISIIYLDY